MEHVSGEEILIIHSEIIEKTGGSHGIRDIGLFLSLVEKPKIGFGGAELYEGVWKKAAAYCEGFAKYHVFMDGNKRTAMAVAARFLYVNKYECTATNKEVEEFAVRIVEEKLDIETIADWLEEHATKHS